MRKLLLYIRASREDLKMSPEGTLTSQRQRLEEYVKSRNIVTPGWGKVVGVYMDEAKSAKDTNRPQFQEMLRMVELRKGDTILVTELSRLSRSMKDFCGIWDFLKSHRAQFLTLREQFDTTTAAGEMMMYSIMNFAQFERKQTSERVVANFHARALRGLYNGGYPAIGYDSDPGRKGYLVVNESEAHDVRRIFKIFAEKGSLKTTLDEINAQGIKTKRRTYQDGRIEEGKPFTLNSLWGVLRNRHYIGEREIHKRFRYWDKEKVPEGKEYQIAKASWPAIVPPELFQAIQSRLNWNIQKYRPEALKNFEYVFSSTVFCGECGLSMVGRSGKAKGHGKHFYYAHKIKKKESRNARGCQCRWYSFDALDLHKIMRNRVKKIAENPAFIEALYQNAEVNKAALIPDNERRSATLEGEIKELSQQVANLIDTLQNTPSQIVRDLVTKELDSKGQSLKVKTTEQNSLQSQSAITKATPIEKNEFSEFAKTWDRFFAKLTASERKDFIRTIIGRIEIFPDKIRVRFNYDQRTVAQALNVIDMASFRSSRGASSEGLAPHPLFSKRVQRASHSNVFITGRGNHQTSHYPDPVDKIDLFHLRPQGIFEKAAPLYELGHSLREISRLLGIPKTTVRQSLMDGGIVLRSSARSPRQNAPQTTRAHIGVAPYGYCTILGKLVEVPKEQQTIHLVLQLRTKGMSLNAIADHLNRHKIKARSGGKWDHSTVRSIVNRNQPQS